MGGKKAPDPPDYRGAAEQQAEASEQITREQTYANRPTQTTPWGTVSWDVTRGVDPASGQAVPLWSQNLQLNPQQQAALNAQMQLQQQRSGLAGGLYDRMASEFAEPVNWDQFTPFGDVPTPGEFDPSQRYYQDAEDAIYGQFERRMEPRFEQQANAMDTRLRNQGLRPGDEAYDFQMQQLRQQQDDARTGAQYQATIGAGQEAKRMLGMDMGAQQQTFGQGMASAGFQTQLRQQQIAEEMQRRGFTLNEINAILTGQQVAQPSMPGFNTAQRSQAPQYMQAAQLGYQADLDAFNADQAMLGGLMSGLTGMGSAYLGRPIG